MRNGYLRILGLANRYEMMPGMGVMSDTYSARCASRYPGSLVFNQAVMALEMVISLATKRTKTDEELKGLVYSLTPKTVDGNMPVWQRPAVVGVVLLIVCVILNVIFW